MRCDSPVVNPHSGPVGVVRMIVIERATSASGEQSFLLGSDGVKYEAHSMRGCLQAVEHLLSPTVGQHINDAIKSCVVCKYNRENKEAQKPLTRIQWLDATNLNGHKE